jgi:hypothetical protein
MHVCRGWLLRQFHTNVCAFHRQSCPFFACPVGQCRRPGHSFVWRRCLPMHLCALHQLFKGTRERQSPLVMPLPMKPRASRTALAGTSPNDGRQQQPCPRVGNSFGYDRVLIALISLVLFTACKRKVADDLEMLVMVMIS